MEEIWKDLPIRGKNSRYQVSNMGRVRTIHMVKGIDTSIRILRTCICKSNGTKRLCLTLRNKGKQKTYNVHMLVAKTFVDNPNNYTVIKHIDGNFENNVASNLTWAPHRFFGHVSGEAKKRTLKIVQRTIDWLYEQLNNGRIECGNMEEFIEDYKSAMQQHSPKQSQ